MAKAKNAKLRLTTVSTNGKWSPSTNKGAAYITVNGKDNRTDQIAVQVPYSSKIDGAAQDGEDALINITFEGGKTWSGTFAELYDLLNGRVSHNEESHIEEMLCPDMGDGTHNDIIRLKKGEVLAISEFNIEVYQSDEAYLQEHTPLIVTRPVRSAG